MKKIENNTLNKDSLTKIIAELDFIMESIGEHYTNNTNLLHDSKDSRTDIFTSLKNIENDIASIYGKISNIGLTYVFSSDSQNNYSNSQTHADLQNKEVIGSGFAAAATIAAVIVPEIALPLEAIAGIASLVVAGLQNADNNASRPPVREAPGSYAYDLDIAAGKYTAATKEEIPEAVIAKSDSGALLDFHHGDYGNCKTIDEFTTFYLNLPGHEDLKAEVEKEQKNFVPPKPAQLTVAIGGNGTVANTASILSQMPSSSTIEPDISAIKASVESISLNTGNLANEYLEFLNNLDMVVLVPEQVKNSFDDFTKNITDLSDRIHSLDNSILNTSNTALDSISNNVSDIKDHVSGIETLISGGLPSSDESKVEKPEVGSYLYDLAIHDGKYTPTTIDEIPEAIIAKYDFNLLTNFKNNDLNSVSLEGRQKFFDDYFNSRPDKKALLKYETDNFDAKKAKESNVTYTATSISDLLKTIPTMETEVTEMHTYIENMYNSSVSSTADLLDLSVIALEVIEMYELNSIQTDVKSIKADVSTIKNNLDNLIKNPPKQNLTEYITIEHANEYFSDSRIGTIAINAVTNNLKTEGLTSRHGGFA